MYQASGEKFIVFMHDVNKKNSIKKGPKQNFYYIHYTLIDDIFGVCFHQLNHKINISPNMTQNPKVLIIEDHDIVVSALTIVLKENFQKFTLQKAGSFPKGLKMLGDALYDLIILDVDVPGSESYAMIGRLRNVQKNVRILIFTGQDETKHALKFLTAGANGYLSKVAPTEEFGAAIRTVLSDKKYVSDSVQELITASYFEKMHPKPGAQESPLSPREHEVLDLLLEGKWTKDIATELKLKLTTVSTHKTRIFQKLEVDNVIDLFKKMKPGG
jgi:DNA-binding NarL/FixJ family response regulator